LVNQMAFSSPVLPKNEISSAKQIKVSVTNSQACPRYVSRVIESINANAVTPIWLQEQLRRSGQRCIHPVVDILNYVMLELGQPMHAFDLAKINGEIQVRSAAAGEKITLLDEQQATLDADTLVIADANNVIALAGVMGGADSAVSESTTAVVLESAFFAPLSIRRASSVYNIKSESSYRFERGVDWNLQIRAMERATELILQFCGGHAADIVAASSAADLPQTQSLSLRSKQLKRILGVAIADEEVTRILTGLQLQPQFASNQWQITVPSFRFDLQQEIDLVEEVVRVYGYQQVPTTLQTLTMPMVSQAETDVSVANIKESLVAQGYQEAITYSFISAELMQQFTPDIEALTLNNPISSDLSHMRASILPSLISALKYNLNRQCSRVRLFEVGRVYFPSDSGDLDQPMRIAMLANGAVLPEQWSSESKVVDYFDMKADVEALLQKTYHAEDYQWNLATHPALHPGKTAELSVLGQHVGFLGELHPTLAAEYDMATAPVLFEGNWALMSKARVPAYAPISRFPVMRRDLALVLEQSYGADEILAEVRFAGGSLLSKVEIFDIYQGKGIAAGKKSVALGLIFQDASRTLVEEEVETVLREIVTHLQNRMDATMRA
jgi:phenylalanyl-tRNA synthetase beta chain